LCAADGFGFSKCYQRISRRRFGTFVCETRPSVRSILSRARSASGSTACCIPKSIDIVGIPAKITGISVFHATFACQPVLEDASVDEKRAAVDVSAAIEIGAVGEGCCAGRADSACAHPSVHTIRITNRIGITVATVNIQRTAVNVGAASVETARVWKGCRAAHPGGACASTRVATIRTTDRIDITIAAVNIQRTAVDVRALRVLSTTFVSCCAAARER
jgi:hypothetical protein